MGEQESPGENQEDNRDANDDWDHDAGIPGDARDRLSSRDDRGYLPPRDDRDCQPFGDDHDYTPSGDDYGCAPEGADGGRAPQDADDGGCAPQDADDGDHAPDDAGDGGYVPEEWELEGPAVSISLGEAADLDPALLAAMTGPDGLGGNALCRAYEQDAAADVLRPGPVLAALTEQAARDVGRLSDEQLMGALSAARRLENRAAYLQAVTIAEFARRRAAQADAAAAARPVRKGRRSGDFPDEELAMELLASEVEAGARIEAATCLTARLPHDAGGAGRGQHRLRARVDHRVLHRQPVRRRRGPRR